MFPIFYHPHFCTISFSPHSQLIISITPVLTTTQTSFLNKMFSIPRPEDALIAIALTELPISIILTLQYNKNVMLITEPYLNFQMSHFKVNL